jgi:tetratricopeptide (TPR) repeat protein
VDENTFADVRAKLADQAEAPDAQTLADTYFEEAVKAFEAGNYSTAADKFTEAINLAPDDQILPFAYVQALFADKKYLQAATVLREALEKVSASLNKLTNSQKQYRCAVLTRTCNFCWVINC